MPQPITYLLTKDMSHDGQNILRVDNTTLHLVALCHRSTSGFPTSCLSTSPNQPMVSVYHHAQHWHPPNEEYHHSNGRQDVSHQPFVYPLLHVEWSLECPTNGWAPNSSLLVKDSVADLHDGALAVSRSCSLLNT